MMIAIVLACLVPVIASRSVCAAEGYECDCMNKMVYYGYGSKWNSKFVYGFAMFGGTTDCTNSEFGDPSFGNKKYCVCATSSVKRVEDCASEGGYCQCSGGLVYYGAEDRWTGKSGSQACNNANFGDPIYGVKKSCVCLTY